MLLRCGLDCSLNSAAEAWKVANDRAAVCWKILTARLAALKTNQGEFVANCLLARSLVWGLARWWGVFEREGNRANRPDRVWCAIWVVDVGRCWTALSSDALRHGHAEPGHPVQHRAANPGFGLLGR